MIGLRVIGFNYSHAVWPPWSYLGSILVAWSSAINWMGGISPTHEIIHALRLFEQAKFFAKSNMYQNIYCEYITQSQTVPIHFHLSPLIPVLNTMAFNYITKVAIVGVCRTIQVNK